MKIQFLLQTNKNRYMQKKISLKPLKSFPNVSVGDIFNQIIYKPVSKIEMKFLKILIQFLDTKRVEKKLLTY